MRDKGLGVGVSFKVDDTKFQDALFRIQHRFVTMVQTMMDIHSLIHANTNQLVPLDTGRLESSFYPTIYDSNQEITLISTYDAVDPKYGFHYAYYQHELTHRGIGTYSLYSRAKSGFGSSTVEHHRHGTRGTDHYLLKGVRASESMMWTIIETDYLSLFYGEL